MPTRVRPRFGSLQYWPRKRIRKAVPSVNWSPVEKSASKTVSDEGLLGFISYKVGMTSVIVKDNTDKSMTKGKKVTMPATILEVPNFKIFSVRFYKKGKVMKDVIVSTDKILKKKLKIPKEVQKIEGVEGFDDIRVIIYPVMKDMFKKAPDLAEVGIKAADKLEFIKGLIGKEISMAEVMKWNLVDVRGLTRGKGFQGPVKRFGITLKSHKSEKGVRRPGSIGPWHPARVIFRVPMAGQLGTFTRVHYNSKVIDSGNIKDEGKDINRKNGFKNYGNVAGSYIMVAGSVQGPSKRQILITPAMRPNKKQTKRQYELLEVLK